MRRAPTSILITGASSGIGRALALAYAAPGIRLALLGRDATRLTLVMNEARAKGADVVTGVIDVRDRAAMADWIAKADATQPIDLAIANAGITTGLGPDEIAEDPDAVRAIIATNLLGPLNTVEPLMAPMAARGRGHLAFVGSIAGLRGLPYSPAYCLTKSGIQGYSESIRARLEAKGVLVTLIVAGMVKTPLNDSISAIKPGEVSDVRAAEIIKRGLDRGRAIVAFPTFLYVATCSAGFCRRGSTMRSCAGSRSTCRTRVSDSSRPKSAPIRRLYEPSADPSGLVHVALSSVSRRACRAATRRDGSARPARHGAGLRSPAGRRPGVRAGWRRWVRAGRRWWLRARRRWW